MEDTPKRPFGVKLLAIVGFSATVLLIGWVILTLITKGESLFSSLADKVREREEYVTEEQTPQVSATPAEEDVAVPPPEDAPAHVPDVPAVAPTESASPAAPRTTSLPLAVDTGLYGYVDLAVTTRGAFAIGYGTYAVQVDITNLGTITSAPWSFSTMLPDGTVYTSPTQASLKPAEHAVFTIQFGADYRGYNNIVSVIYTTYDSNIRNNASTVRY